MSEDREQLSTATAAVQTRKTEEEIPDDIGHLSLMIQTMALHRKKGREAVASDGTAEREQADVTDMVNMRGIIDHGLQRTDQMPNLASRDHILNKVVRLYDSATEIKQTSLLFNLEIMALVLEMSLLAPRRPKLFEEGEIEENHLVLIDGFLNLTTPRWTWSGTAKQLL